MERVIAFFLVASTLFISGCATGPDYAKAKKELHESAAKSEAYAEKDKKQFHDCVHLYISKNFESSATATELYEASLYECQIHLGSYDMARYAFHFARLGEIGYGTKSYEYVQETAKSLASEDRQRLLETERQLSIKNVIEERQRIGR